MSDSGPPKKWNQSELGKKVAYDSSYNPQRLFSIPRRDKRREMGIDPLHLPFSGFDCWNHYEVSWLNKKGKPLVATAEIYYDCCSDFMIESKSMKLYFNSLNHSKFDSVKDVTETIRADISQAIDSDVTVFVHPLRDSKSPPSRWEKLKGECIDDLDIECNTYLVEPSYLSSSDEVVTEILYSDLLKSNCLVTNQPDWGSVQISYTGHKIDREGLLKYLISFRNHAEFHEPCMERIFRDIMQYCKPLELTVYGRYTRRGGLDINPYRSTKAWDIRGMNYRLIRQ
jgi:7-cyano-7-deazaguanine reductase